MPQVRKLSTDEVRTIENKTKGVRQLTEEQYDQMLTDFTIGDYGMAVPDRDEKRLTVRNRIKAAGKRRNISVIFIPTRSEEMRFKVVSGNESATEAETILAQALEPEPEPEPMQPVKKRGGRAKKQTA